MHIFIPLAVIHVVVFWLIANFVSDIAYAFYEARRDARLYPKISDKEWKERQKKWQAEKEEREEEKRKSDETLKEQMLMFDIKWLATTRYRTINQWKKGLPERPRRLGEA
jgi:hypothetical protein